MKIAVPGTRTGELDDGRFCPEWVAYSSHDFEGDDLRRRWDGLDGLVHAIAFAPREALKGPSRACHERGPEGAESSGGGGGIRTRVRKYIPAGIYDAYPPLKCRTRREEAEKPPGTRPEKSRC